MLPFCAVSYVGCCSCVEVGGGSSFLVRTLELVEKGVELFPIILGQGEFAVFAGLDVLGPWSVRAQT